MWQHKKSSRVVKSRIVLSTTKCNNSWISGTANDRTNSRSRKNLHLKPTTATISTTSNPTSNSRREIHWCSAIPTFTRNAVISTPSSQIKSYSGLFNLDLTSTKIIKFLKIHLTLLGFNWELFRSVKPLVLKVKMLIIFLLRRVRRQCEVRFQLL